MRPYKHRDHPHLWYGLPKCFMSNVTYLNNKLEKLHTTITSISPGIVDIIEAWRIPADALHTPNYTPFHRLRTKNKRGGGMVLICHDLSPPPVTCKSRINWKCCDCKSWCATTPAKSCPSSAVFSTIHHGPITTTSCLITLPKCQAYFVFGILPSRSIICGDFINLTSHDLQTDFHLTLAVNFSTYENDTLDLILTDLHDWYKPPQPLSLFSSQPTHVSAGAAFTECVST